jgi:hypothetical protein
MPTQESILVLHPGGPADRPGVSVARRLARRLLSAAREVSPSASPAASDDLPQSGLRDVTVLVVDPVLCAFAAGDRRAFLDRLSEAGRRVAIHHGPADERYRNQLRLAADFDLFLDLGFVDKSPARNGSGPRYRLLFDAPTAEEAQHLSAESEGERPIPWVLAAAETPENTALLAELMESVDPRGSLCLLEHTPAGDRSVLGEGAEGRLLSRTGLCLWPSGGADHFESQRFAEALVAGAAPCELGRRSGDLPNAFGTVGELKASLEGEGATVLWRRARDFHLSRGTLAQNLREALEDV